MMDLPNFTIFDNWPACQIERRRPKVLGIRLQLRWATLSGSVIVFGIRLPIKMDDCAQMLWLNVSIKIRNQCPNEMGSAFPKSHIPDEMETGVLSLGCVVPLLSAIIMTSNIKKLCCRSPVHITVMITTNNKKCHYMNCVETSKINCKVIKY